MAQDTTKLVIEIEQILKGLDKTLKGLGATKKALESVASVKLNQQSAQSIQRAAVAAQKLAVQQQKLTSQAQELSNRQERARQTTERLRQAQERLAQTQQRLSRASRLGPQSDAHVQAFRARQREIETQQKRAEQFEARQFRLRQQRAKQEAREISRINAQTAKQAQQQAQFRERMQGAMDRGRLQTTQRQATEQANLFIRSLGSQRDAVQALSQRLTSLGKSLTGVGQSMSSVGATLSVSLTAPLVALGAVTVNAAVRVDSLRRGLTAIVGSSTEAGRQLERLTQLAKLPGIGFEEAIQGSIRLQAVGFSAQEAEANLREFANAIALTGGGRDELSRVTVQLGQLAAKGKVLSQDLRPIIEAAPAVGRALLEAFGTVNADDIQELGLSSKQFLGILVDQLGKLPRAAAGARNSFENFTDAAFRAAAIIGESFLPILTRLAEAAGPILEGLARVFGAIPKPIQIIVVGLVALAAALGPVLFVVGQLTAGVGRLLVGFAQLNTLGILPTIRSLRALTAGTLTAAQAHRTLAATTALVAGGVGAVIAVIGTLITAYALYNALQKDTVTLSREQVNALTDQINGLEQQAKFIDSLQSGVERTADEQRRLLEIYNQLNVIAKARVTGIEDEEKQLAALREELQQILQLRRDERAQQAANLAAIIANNALAVESENQAIERITVGVQVRTRLIETLQETNKVTADQQKQVAALTAEYGGLRVQTNDVGTAIRALQTSNRGLIARQDELRESGKGVRDTLDEQIPLIKQLSKETGLSAQQLLITAKAMGVFRGDVSRASQLLEEYIRRTREATEATEKFRDALSSEERELLKAGERADQEAKRRRAHIAAAASLAREASDSFEGALKFLRAFMAAQPGLRADIERERQLQGKSLEEFLEDALQGAFKGRDKAKSSVGSGLRNAQEQLQQALAELARAGGEQQGVIERQNNERLLQINENAHRLQLISYRQYLNERGRLTSANLALEINAQREIVNDALAEQRRLIERADKPGLPPAERTKAEAGAAAAFERAIKATTRILELEKQQRDVRLELTQLLAEASRQQEQDVRQLDIEFAELTGRIEDALNAATVERFREQLEALGKDQKRISEELEVARLARDAEDIEQLERASRLNQSQIDLVEGIVAQEQAANRLAVAQRFIEQAREKQAELEQQLTFEVEHRGLTEEEAIQRRLAGEQQLADRLRLSRDIIQDTVNALNAQGVKPPQALLDFIREVNTAVRGLGELPFSEQFRLVEKEFIRLNDERIRRIQDVERAVRNRDIAEIEGAILIKRINGEYTASLEQQLALLRQIAEASGQPELRRQAEDAGEVVKDTRDEVAGLFKQIESAGKDASRAGLKDFFNDILNRTATAKEALLGLLNSVTTAINDVIAEELSKKLFESIFGGAENQAVGLIAAVKRLFGFAEPEASGAGALATTGAAEVAKGLDATTVVATLTAGATAASTALATGGATAAATLATGITAAAASFSAAVVAAGAAFAASVTAGAGLQAAGGLGGALGAATGMFPAVPGGMYKFVEGGYPEAVLTTDPRHAARQATILREYLKQTKGLFGRIPGFASGAFVTRHEAEADMLSSINRAPQSFAHIPEAALASGGRGVFTLRQVFVDDQRDISNWVNSADGDRVQIQWLARNRVQVRRLLGVRE